MCGRYTGDIDESEVLRGIYDLTWKLYPDAELAAGDIYPTNTAPVLVGNSMKPLPAKWGFPWCSENNRNRNLINARAETAAEKLMFRDSLLWRRCAVPTTGYYEWDKDKHRYRFNLYGDRFLYLAGLFRRYDDGCRFVILTTASNDSVSEIHDRMPLILPDDTVVNWLRQTPFALSYLSEAMPPLERIIV